MTIERLKELYDAQPFKPFINSLSRWTCDYRSNIAISSWRFRAVER